MCREETRRRNCCLLFLAGPISPSFQINIIIYGLHVLLGGASSSSNGSGIEIADSNLAVAAIRTPSIRICDQIP